MSQLVAMFCDIDDFCKRFEPIWLYRKSGCLDVLRRMHLIDKMVTRPRGFVAQIERAPDCPYERLWFRRNFAAPLI